MVASFMAIELGGGGGETLIYFAFVTFQLKSKRWPNCVTNFC
ncbi:hypothetical protein F442_17687 [Phytophthora nicotianae P10297]|uniref:Uncharacterized protein n=3 Tax=Phytophthora nicotianae TaxID=4792 RepID=W2R0D9_PHYN3|nr:hypothetical protein PPTG_21591 [Phytophthora nicotianae INRA-310]ETN18711.1 hypothetical protein PPTG_21591 [Phytophthora nicotianae INRA-310]ETO64659.1 hypothetical protein F444_17869 [Phytophthora nicotianae P1976]ETP33871.1 hypothetical protein F442_17687 [Phytophthora nicotianae P10297]